jgi:hypothetical protein
VYRIANTWPVVGTVDHRERTDAVHIAVPLGEPNEPEEWMIRSRSVFIVPKLAASVATDQGELTSERSLAGKGDVK